MVTMTSDLTAPSNSMQQGCTDRVRGNLCSRVRQPPTGTRHRKHSCTAASPPTRIRELTDQNGHGVRDAVHRCDLCDTDSSSGHPGAGRRVLEPVMDKKYPDPTRGHIRD